MQKLYSAGNLQEAYLLLYRLEQAGIDVRLFNEHAHGGLGEIPFTHAYPEIWVVHAQDVERAQAIMRDYEAASQAPARQCPSCREENPGGFEVCWRCGTALG
jgi:Putative prokaryotic signal transducing protein